MKTSGMSPEAGPNMITNLPKRDAEEPHMYDVVLGRGTGVSQHFGNAFFRQLVDEHRPIYQKTKKSEKYNVACSIIRAIVQNGGSFVQPVTVGGTKLRYHSVSLTVARGKTSQALRELNMSHNRQSKIQEAFSLAAAAAAGDSVSLNNSPTKNSPAVSRVELKAETPVPPHPTTIKKRSHASLLTTPASVPKTSSASSKKKKRAKKKSYTTAEWNAVVTPPPTNNSRKGGLASPLPVKPRHDRTTRASIQAQKYLKMEMTNKGDETQPGHSKAGVVPSPSLIGSFGTKSSAGSTHGPQHEDESSIHGTAAVTVNKHPLLLQDITTPCQEKESMGATMLRCPVDESAAAAATFSTTNDGFMRIVPSPLKFSVSSVQVSVPVATRPSRLSMKITEEYKGDNAKPSGHGVLSLGQRHSIASETGTSPMYKEGNIAATATPTDSYAARVARDIDYWGQAPKCSRPSSISNAVLWTSDLPNGTANMGPPARVSDTPRMNNANFHHSQSPAVHGTISSNRLSMVTPSSAFMMSSPTMLGLGPVIGSPVMGSPLVDTFWNESNSSSYRPGFDSSDTRAFEIPNRRFGKGQSPPTPGDGLFLAQTSMGRKGMCVGNDEGTPPSTKTPREIGDHKMLASPDELMCLDFCCLFCSPGNCQERGRPFHDPLGTRVGAATRPWNPVHGQWSPPATSTGWSPIGREIHVPPAASWGDPRDPREASPSPSRMFASIIPSSVSGITNVGSFRAYTSRTNNLGIQSSPSGISTGDSGEFSQWTPSPLFPTDISYSPIDAIPQQKQSNDETGGIATLLEAAMSAKVLNFEDWESTSKQLDKQRSTGIKEKRPKGGPGGHSRTPDKTPRKKPESLSASSMPSVARLAPVSNQAACRPSPRRVSDVTANNVDASLSQPRFDPDEPAPLFMINNPSMATMDLIHSAHGNSPSPRQRESDASSPWSGDLVAGYNIDTMPHLVSKPSNHPPTADSPMTPLKSSRRVSC